MAKNAVIGILVTIINCAAGQNLGVNPYPKDAICPSVQIKGMADLAMDYRHCVIVVGNVTVSLLERAQKKHFNETLMPNLREVTDYLIVYRVRGLDSLKQLFPSLTRIRGVKLMYNFALIVHDNPGLIDIGLISLLKIDRGGVIVWGSPQACYIDTVDWQTIAPRARHVISSTDKHRLCKVFCTCSTNTSYNHCWSNMRCQRFLEGSEGDDIRCHKNCLGCRKTIAEECWACRYFTYKGKCVTECPKDTILLSDGHLCVTIEECSKLNRWEWNNTCVDECPIGFVKENSSAGIVTCSSCNNCFKTCNKLVLQTTSAIQQADSCVFINGSLTIHVRSVPEPMKELRTYLNRIQEVSDYIKIYSSPAITSLDFLSSLRSIGGKELKNGRYSLVIYDMVSLQTLFTTNVTKNLKIRRGTMKINNNPVLCMHQIDKIKPTFPIQPNDVDVRNDSNGYSGGCNEVAVNFQVRALNETSAIVTFIPKPEIGMIYTVLYVHLSRKMNVTVVPESCSEEEWDAIHIKPEFGQIGLVQLTSLHPASTYAVCIETYDFINNRIGRSRILNFTTAIGIPKPPFIMELVASSWNVVVLRWMDHQDFLPYITNYELDVELIDYYSTAFKKIDYCRHEVLEELSDTFYTRHAVVMRPPLGYGKGCESMCGILSSVTPGAMVEDYFDVCDSTELDCNILKDIPPKNTTVMGFVNTLALNITGLRNDFQVGNLAPFRDYKFKLRACVESKCSRSAKGVVRTLSLKDTDKPKITYVQGSEKGDILVKWDPPKISNGPVLSYTVEVLPRINFEKFVHFIPQSWCVSADTREVKVVSVSADSYKVRVCTTTFASLSTCTTWQLITFTKTYPTSWWWTGAIFGVVLYIVSSVVGIFCKRPIRTDVEPLVSNSSNLRIESEPPSERPVHIVQSYAIPLRDTVLHR